VISHDRCFLDRTVKRIFALEDGRFSEHIGGYSDYAAKT
jgi:ATPase subunit of ABC transporter with duplicated ATPase domains